MNVICITGRLTADPELKQTSNDVSVTSFSVAVRRPHSKEATDFLNVTAWRQSAEYLCRYAAKGNQVSISGMLTTRSYEDKNGYKRTVYEIQAENVEILESRRTESRPDVTGEDYGGVSRVPAAASAAYSQGKQSSFADLPSNDDDLPF